MTRPLPACAGHLTGSKCSGKEIMENSRKWFKLVHADNFRKGIRFFTYICSLRNKKQDADRQPYGGIIAGNYKKQDTMANNENEAEKQRQQVEALKLLVEEKLKRKLCSPTDFNFLSLKVQETLNEPLSTSTIKRLWGYVRTTHVPSHSTLSILSRLTGYRNWEDFCQSAEPYPDAESSGFLANRPIEASELQEGDVIDLEWEPDRCCRIVCTGNAQFRVLSQRNSKLRPGDTFHTTLFCPGLPLCITDLRRDGESPRYYVAGKRKGVRLTLRRR